MLFGDSLTEERSRTEIRRALAHEFRRFADVCDGIQRLQQEHALCVLDEVSHR